MRKNNFFKTFLYISSTVSFLAPLALVPLSSQAIVIRTGCAPLAGIPKPEDRYCTLNELFAGAGASIQVGDKLFSQFMQRTNTKNGAAGGVDTNNIQVFGIDQDTNAPGLLFMSVNNAAGTNELTVQGADGSLFLEFDFLVTLLGTEQKIIDNELGLIDQTVKAGNPLFNPDTKALINIEEKLADALGSSNFFETKSVMLELPLRPQPGPRIVDRKKFAPKQQIAVKKIIKLETGIAGDEATLRKFRQKFSQAEKKDSDKDKRRSSDEQQSTIGLATFDGVDKLSFSNIFIDTVFLDGGIPSNDDPILGANVLVNDISLIGGSVDDGGFTFEDTTIQFIASGIPVLTADVRDTFLFVGSKANPNFDSEFQGIMDNIVINNLINSPYLDQLQVGIEAGDMNHFAFASNLLSATNNLTMASSSTGQTWAQDGTKKSVPESSTILGLLTISGMALGTSKRKQS